VSGTRRRSRRQSPQELRKPLFLARIGHSLPRSRPPGTDKSACHPCRTCIISSTELFCQGNNPAQRAAAALDRWEAHSCQTERANSDRRRTLHSPAGRNSSGRARYGTARSTPHSLQPLRKARRAASATGVGRAAGCGRSRTAPARACPGRTGPSKGATFSKRSSSVSSHAGRVGSNRLRAEGMPPSSAVSVLQLAGVRSDERCRSRSGTQAGFPCLAASRSIPQVVRRNVAVEDAVSLQKDLRPQQDTARSASGKSSVKLHSCRRAIFSFTFAPVLVPGTDVHQVAGELEVRSLAAGRHSGCRATAGELP
jgi:hypothetical protein